MLDRCSLFVDLLDDERLTKMNLLISKLKMRYSKKLNQQINENDKDYQLLQEKLSIDENLIKKIREMKRRKALIKEEYNNSVKEIKQLKY